MHSHIHAHMYINVCSCSNKPAKMSLHSETCIRAIHLKCLN